MARQIEELLLLTLLGRVHRGHHVRRNPAPLRQAGAYAREVIGGFRFSTARSKRAASGTYDHMPPEKRALSKNVIDAHLMLTRLPLRLLTRRPRQIFWK
jgi:hypothetical protein